ncbi:MAG: MarR family winged helix-turn-helix transcriptional regulator [Clostridium sp.]|uniref:MarR family winged helix-turn-helix transcriptional regulator n=1 Tax=Clostridium sp. TaxID=1506 RepID=UPI003F377F4D
MKQRIETSFQITKLIKDIDLEVYNILSKELKETELTPQQLTVVKHLGHHGEMTVSEICAVMNLTKGTVSGILNRMERLGYIKKIKHDEDKRNTYITFTEKGRFEGRKYMLSFNKVYSNIFKNIEECKLEEIKKGLEEIIQKIRESE